MGREPTRRPARSEGGIDLFSHPQLAELHPTGHHPERPERLATLLEAFAWTEGRLATEEEILRCHGAKHVAALRSITGPTWLDSDTPASETTYEAALLAAGTTIEAAAGSGLALVRPPGHHAPANRAMGFCFFNNIAIAARAEQAAGVARVAIVDIDVHHGNGTQDIFWDDDSVFFASLHQWPFYPGSGGPQEQRETTLNVPMSAGSGDDEYLHAFDHRVVPAVESFGPDLVLVSAGFDAHQDDPLAEMNVTEAGFRELARRCTSLAPRTAAVLEGGYNIQTLTALVGAALEGFA